MKDFTSGNIAKQMVLFAMPMLVGGIVQQLYSMLDMFIVGNIEGSRQLAAIGAGDSPAFFARAIVIGVCTGFSAVTAKNFGANNLPMLRKVTASALYISLAAAIILVFGGIFGAGHIMALMRTPDDIMAEAVLYLQITIGASLGMVFYNTAAALLRGVGDSKMPLVFLIAAFLVNIPLTLLFVAWLGLGVAGAAAASVIAQALSAAACWIFMFKKYEFFRLALEDAVPNLESMWQILRIGIPVGLQSLLMAAGDMTIASVVNGFGTDVVAAYVTGNRIMLNAMFLTMYVAMAHAVFAGQNLGAKEIGRIRRGFKETAVLITALSIIIAVVVFVFGDVFVRLFIADADAYIEEIIPIARQFLRIGTVFYISLGLIWLYNYTLTGMGEVIAPFISSICELAAKVGGSLILSQLFGYVGIWFANPIGWMLGLVPSVIWYHMGRWAKRG
jgi:putative MATE family efflux protein